MYCHLMVFNAGSSSLKFGLYAWHAGAVRVDAAGVVEQRGAACHLFLHHAPQDSVREKTWDTTEASFHAEAMRGVLAWKQAVFPSVTLAGVGHRVVHGGLGFDRPVVVDADAMIKLRALVPLAPLHQPHNLEGILAAQGVWPSVPQVACFDTAFHRGHLFVQDAFALPRSYYDEGVRRYGFHGLSYEYVLGRLKRMEPTRALGRVVIAHLGNGASMCAVQNGKSVATSMGFTALDGLPMGTRCGQIDPGVLLYLMQEKGLTAEALTTLLYTQSGLKGLSGLSGDMRELLAAPQPEAKEAIAYFVARIRRELGSMAVLLGGLDAFIFCGGIGEHAAPVREAVLQGLGWLGLDLDRVANQTGQGVISTHASPVRVLVIPTDEESMIAEHVAEVLQFSVF